VLKKSLKSSSSLYTKKVWAQEPILRLLN
jgi:hypothetical protein